MDCRTISNGIVRACKEVKLDFPLVVRVEGLNVKEAREILETSGLPISAAMSLGEAAEKVVKSLEH